MLSYLLASLQFYHVAWLFSQVTADIIIIVDFPQETDALRILTLGIHQMFALRYLAHLVLHIVTDGKECLLQLPVVDLSEKVGLVLDGVRTGDEPLPACFVSLGLGIVSCSDEIIVMPAFLIEGSELDQTITHHVGVGRKACTHLVHRIARHLIPVFAMTVDDLQAAAILMRHRRRHLQILFRRAVPFLRLLRSYLNIETIGMKSESCKLIHHDAAIDTAREQHRDPLILQFINIHHACH